MNVNNAKIRTCAVVGAGESILECEYGQIIDAYDIVMRCNRAITKGYEKHVGTRTDYRVLGYSATKALDDKNFRKQRAHVSSHWTILDLEEIVQPGEILITPEVQLSDNTIQKLALQRIQVINDHEEYLKLPEKIGGAAPSSGLSAMWFARHTLGIETVHCFGFDQYKRKQNANMSHYYETVFCPPFCKHNFVAEYKFSQKIGVTYITKENYGGLQD